jgi:hypothetical protein
MRTQNLNNQLQNKEEKKTLDWIWFFLVWGIEFKG